MGALGNLIPLIILFVFVGAFAFVGYQVRHHSQTALSALHLPITRLTHWQQMYVWTNDLADQGKKKMEKKNVKFSKDGMQVGVKEISEEDYADKTQSVLVNTWNSSSFPAYKSRFWNKEEQAKNKASSSGRS
ncbi:hypothetical protein D6C95_07139 [Aureobasidium pullulans]|nr:hypothetical protein D6C95_07139 [Aureobasidium pullulans]